MAFSVDEPIAVGAAAACVMGDKASGPAKKDVTPQHAIQAIRSLTAFQPMLIPKQLPWQLGVQVGIGLSNWR